jgi:hypothetical protein
MNKMKKTVTVVAFTLAAVVCLNVASSAFNLNRSNSQFGVGERVSSQMKVSEVGSEQAVVPVIVATALAATAETTWVLLAAGAAALLGDMASVHSSLTSEAQLD